MTDAEKKLIILNNLQNDVYPIEVDKLVRAKYSISAELAILRQRDSKPDEFAEYSAYVERCKEFVKNELGINKEV